MLTDKKIKLGVTGFSRTGKTVFIGSLAQALLTTDSWESRRTQGPLSQFTPFEMGQLNCVSIRDDIHSDLPQFPFRKVRDSLTGVKSDWPVPTEGISHLVLDLDYDKKSKFWSWEKTIQLELIDYPGEWLVDLPMLEQSYQSWSDNMLIRAQKSLRADWSKDYFAEIERIEADQDDEGVLERLAEIWQKYLQVAASNGLVFNQPGRLLRSGDLRHSPVLRLAPLPDKLRHGSLGAKLKKRFDAYKQKVVRPFYKNYFASIDRQIVLIDILQILELGEPAYKELMDALKLVLKSFHYGKGSILDWLKGHNTTHVLFAATKADHVIRGDRANLEKMLRKIIRQLYDDNRFRRQVKHHDIIEIASVKATEDHMTVKPPKREILYGKPVNVQQAGAYDPGGLPLDIPPDWETLEFQFLHFSPAPMPNAFDDGFPAINLGKALNFLIAEDFN